MKLEDAREELGRMQDVLYAHDRYAVLILFQAMDTAGKDGAIKHVMSGVNPQGCQVFSFRRPSEEELDHDFLWRTTRCLPERGRIGIFNRSYYEEVIVTRVHPEILERQKIPAEVLHHPDRLWKARYQDIVDFERYLGRNGTRIVKFFIHISKEEQRQRLLERIEKRNKNWKFSPADVEERRHWARYMEAYEQCLKHTSTDYAPWYVIPGDDKKNARLIISHILVERMKRLKMRYPEVTEQQEKILEQMRQALEAEERDEKRRSR